MVDLDRKWLVADPSGDYIYTEERILREYWPWWSSKLRELGREHLISPGNCVDDWCVVNWAVRVE